MLAQDPKLSIPIQTWHSMSRIPAWWFCLGNQWSKKNQKPWFSAEYLGVHEEFGPKINACTSAGLHINVKKKSAAPCSSERQFSAAMQLLSACGLADIKEQINNFISGWFHLLSPLSFDRTVNHPRSPPTGTECFRCLAGQPLSLQGKKNRRWNTTERGVPFRAVGSSPKQMRYQII